LDPDNRETDTGYKDLQEREDNADNSENEQYFHGLIWPTKWVAWINMVKHLQ
jgi:hypothetical protein